MKKILAILLSSIFILILAAGCDETPNWKIRAYENGPIASGTIVDISVNTGHSSWSGDWATYIIRLDTGTIVVLKQWEYRRAGRLEIGDKVVVYFAWQSGTLVEPQK